MEWNTQTYYSTHAYFITFGNLVIECLNPETHLLSKGRCNYPAFLSQNIWFAHADSAILCMQKSFLKSGTHTQYIRAPLPICSKSRPFISPPYLSSKLTLKWWSFIKAAAARKNSIVISVLREEFQIWEWGCFFVLCVDLLRKWFTLQGTFFRRWLGFEGVRRQRSHFTLGEIS